MPVIQGGITREILTPDVVAREMQIISSELHCIAVRITGQDITRFKMAAHIAARQVSMGWLIVDRDTQPWCLKKPLVRDEGVQARYLTDMLALFEDETFHNLYTVSLGGTIFAIAFDHLAATWAVECNLAVSLLRFSGSNMWLQ